LVARYPATTVARSAIRLLAVQGADTSGLHLLLRAVVADTIPAPLDSLLVRPDTSATAGAPADTIIAPPDTSGVRVDSLGTRPIKLPRRGSAPPREIRDIDLRTPAPGDSVGLDGRPASPGDSAAPRDSVAHGDSAAPRDSVAHGDSAAPRDSVPHGDSTAPGDSVAPGDSAAPANPGPMPERRTP
jgi:hypothetical protein